MGLGAGACPGRCPRRDGCKRDRPCRGSTQSCPRKDALGTSRTLAVDAASTPRVGLKSFPQTLPLADHEVVLTFDKGP